ncbi:ImmA/IrrE family metallo-endopeptidase [Roseibium denhamense]|uniref:IrrE N-terminal-like domain-containing protein n=1 Tax=Roseibium denhamense TaxID=76305 RepID=A0ABY1PMB6_9HYPH|nr:ImmA/IrrE family metallo-endopeptidase [Roseibium denhamense]MTI06972.1 ImmA/IrrE family metallo-endopeptidase [Roseibium denhamense]SMP36677.1 protein of unknown function [Roseibium denhamense]
MSAPRLILAANAAQKVVQESAQTDLPICPFAIAEKECIEVVAKPADVEGVSGGMVFQDPPIIFYSTTIRSRAFQRFTVAHELGHYFVDGHWDRMGTAGMHVSRAGFGRSRDPFETEADHFAASLLMPRAHVRRLLNRAPNGLAAVRALARDAETSLTSSAIRIAECSDEPFAMVMSQQGKIGHVFMSAAFKRLKPRSWLRKGDAVPESATRRFSADPGRVTRSDELCVQTRMEHWFGSGDRGLDEEIIGLGSYGRTLTILSCNGDPETNVEEENEEERLLDSWTPRHAYGR